jgi:hypothetical protein
LFDIGIHGRAADGKLFDKIVDGYAVMIGVHNSCA